jgi:hypothetical protein
MNVKNKISDIEVNQLDKLNSTFTMEEWQGFSIKAILAHCVDESSYDEVLLTLESLKDD